MKLKSNFKSDLRKEQQLSVLLDSIYSEQLKNYDFERIADVKRQLQGIDIVLTHHKTKKTFLVDEKAQLDYLNEDLPTFAFELNYQKNKEPKIGWLFDVLKKTDIYALVTAIYSDEPNVFTSCKITFVNRKKLLTFLAARNISQRQLEIYQEKAQGQHGKIKIKELDSRLEGYLYLSTLNKAEMPFNLILKLDFLIDNGLAKRLI